MSIDRCVCTNLTFAALKRTAEGEGLDFDALRERTRCCRSCALCEPYVRQMLATGRTSFPVEAISSAAAAGQAVHPGTRPSQD